MRRVAPLLAVLLVAGVSSAAAWHGPVRWSTDPDTLFYEAKTLSFRGEDEHVALHRLFAGEEGRSLRQLEAQNHPVHPQFTNPEWIDYNARFFRRRFFVPLLAAASYPIWGERSLSAVAAIGYIGLSATLYALLRRRFSPVASAVATCICILAPPLRRLSYAPMSDTWAILLETFALLCASFVLERRWWWLVPWLVTLLAASFTRDVAIVPVTAACCLILHPRVRRQSAVLAATGAAAIGPALLLFGNASIRENLAYVFNSSNPPTDASWRFVLHQYGPHFRALVRDDVRYGTTLGWQSVLWYIALTLAAIGFVLLVRTASHGDPYFLLHVYAVIGAGIFVAIYGAYSLLRQELALLPSVAVALALVWSGGTDWLASRREREDDIPRRAPDAATHARIIDETPTPASGI